MKHLLGAAITALTIAACAGYPWTRVHAADSPDVRTHAGQFFDELKQQSGPKGADTLGGPTSRAVLETNHRYPSEQYWVGTGHGDLAKGRLVCQRVSELAARTDLAKQIRVMVKEHMIDRVRERSGHPMDQDIELTREEVVQEYLLGVMIVDRQVDEDKKVCTATAVMPKNPLHPGQPSEPGTAPR